MTNDQIIIITTNGLFQVILFLFLKNYLPSYFNEKGRNLATKEDIGTITKIVESVKLGNNAQLEKIKTKLSLVSKTQEIIYDDE
ncbi:MAG: chromosome partitioning protein ParA, partial [Bacteroidetes bacterium]|nr:chromosome partitioning protein ParA [Bacteroidota bacterium]